MNLDLNKLTCGVSLTDTEQAVLEYLLLHLDEVLPQLSVSFILRIH